MVQILIVKKNKINYSKISTIDDIYIKCGFRKVEGFEQIIQWNIENYIIEVWGRVIGKGTWKNTYTFPTEIKNIYGNCAIVLKKDGMLTDLTVDDWDNYFKIIQKEISDLNNLTLEDTNISEISSVMSSSISETTDNDETDKNGSDEENSELRPEEYIYSSEEEIY